MYVQSGVQKIKVYVMRAGGGGGEETQAKGNGEMSPEDTLDTNEETAGNGKMSRRTKRMIVTNVSHAIAVTRQVSNIAFNYLIASLGSRHGDEGLQDSIRRNIEMISDPINVASSVAMGGIYGAWGGPIGSVVGASLGAISSMTSIHYKYASRRRDYSFKIFKENNAIEYQRARANISLTTGRLR